MFKYIKTIIGKWFFKEEMQELENWRVEAIEHYQRLKSFPECSEVVKNMVLSSSSVLSKDMGFASHEVRSQTDLRCAIEKIRRGREKEIVLRANKVRALKAHSSREKV